MNMNGMSIKEGILNILDSGKGHNNARAYNRLMAQTLQKHGIESLEYNPYDDITTQQRKAEARKELSDGIVTHHEDNTFFGRLEKELRIHKSIYIGSYF